MLDRIYRDNAATRFLRRTGSFFESLSICHTTMTAAVKLQPIIIGAIHGNRSGAVLSICIFP
jgi:hypothetical protein